jgi:radical SAM superfamily enzyme YgiQ (UPF0313 family)
VVDEIERLRSEEGVSHFRFAGSNPPWQLVSQIAHEILRRKLDVYYSIFASMNNVRPALFGLLHESGLRAMFVGIESGDSGLVHRALNKRNGRRTKIVHVCQSAMSAGIFVSLSFIVPAPFETEETKRTSLELIEEIFARHSLGSIVLSIPFLAPGSRWWNRKEEYGFELAPGMDERAYVLDIVRQSVDYLLPQRSLTDYGYLLQGKTVPNLLDECEEFGQEIERKGAITGMDDSSYMLAHMGNLDPCAYHELARRNLILGGSDRLCNQVQHINQATPQSREQVWRPSASRYSAA